MTETGVPVTRGPSSGRSDFNGVKAIFERAEQRGEIRTGVKYQVAMQLMIAPLHAHALYTEDAVDEHTLDAVIDMAWPAIAAAASPTRGR
jgi:hypothetical protein